jgi:hypothetical protein
MTTEPSGGLTLGLASPQLYKIFIIKYKIYFGEFVKFFYKPIVFAYYTVFHAISDG